MSRSLSALYLAVVTLTALLTAAHPAAADEVLTEFSTDELNFAVVDQRGKYVVSIKPKGGLANLKKDLTANVFSIENPTRLVIDIPNFPSRQAKTYDLDGRQVSSVRLGVHPDKTRIVLDVSKATSLSYDVAPNPDLGALLVQVGFGGADFSAGSAGSASGETARNSLPPELLKPIGEDPPQTPENAAAIARRSVDVIPKGDEFTEPDAGKLIDDEEDEEDIGDLANRPAGGELGPNGGEPTLGTLEPLEGQRGGTDTFIVRQDRVLDAPRGSIKGLQEKLATKRPDIGSLAPDIAGPAGKSGPVRLSQISYQTRSSGGSEDGSQTGPEEHVVQFAVENLDTYSLRKRDDNLYELTLDKAELAGEHLTLPQFPPDSFAGFEVLMAQPQGDGVVIKIYVEEGVRLAPFIANGQLFVRTAGGE